MRMQNFCAESASYREGKLGMQNFNEKYPHVIENVECRCKICEGSILKSKKRQDVDAIYMTGGVKSICKFKEKQGADTLVAKRASATVNIKVLQIHRSKKEHLQWRINREYRYIRYQKIESTHPSIYFNHDTPQSKKRLCTPANWSRACPTKLSRRA